MKAQSHHTQRFAAETSLSQICQFLKDNGYKIDGELEDSIRNIKRALEEYYNVTKTLEEIQGKIQFFFHEK